MCRVPVAAQVLSGLAPLDWRLGAVALHLDPHLTSPSWAGRRGPRLSVCRSRGTSSDGETMCAVGCYLAARPELSASQSISQTVSQSVRQSVSQTVGLSASQNQSRTSLNRTERWQLCTTVKLADMTSYSKAVLVFAR